MCRWRTYEARGTLENPAEEGRFRTGTAVGVTTYANLFNVNPVVRDCELLIFDDAHGAEQPVADMWTLTVRRSDDPGIYASLLADLRPGLTDSQLREVMDASGPMHVEMVDVIGHPECVDAATATLDSSDADSIRFTWRLVKGKRQSCVFLVSYR